MTVRDATRRESPDGHVLYLEELRRHLGIGTEGGEGSSPTDASPTDASPTQASPTDASPTDASPTDASPTQASPTQASPTDALKARLEILLIGHDMHDDFKKMGEDGINLQKFFHYSGCVDTLVVIEDTGARMGKSLGSLASHYDLAKPEWKSPLCPHIPAKLSFVGAHCGGNDAIVTLGGAIGQALDLSLGTTAREDFDEGKNRPENWLEKPLRGMNTNMILLAYDTEGVENPRYKPFILNRTSEHGFAWLRIADISHVPPGEHGKNWRPFIKARHWINHDFRRFENRYFCIGNPMGFWPEYGESQYYRASEGPAPFHKLFEELAGGAAGAVDGP